jgi:hypothetical protein
MSCDLNTTQQPNGSDNCENETKAGEFKALSQGSLLTSWRLVRAHVLHS